MRGALITLLALIRKELLQAVRDKRMMVMILVAPVIQGVVFGYAANLEFNHADTVFVDEDRSVASRALRDGLAADRTFVIAELTRAADAEGALRRGDAQLAVIVPRHFGRDIAAGNGATVQVLLDGSDPTRGVQAGAAVEAFLATRGVAAGGGGGVTLVPRLYYNPALKSRLFMVPGTAASILLIVTTIITAMGLAREKETGTLEQLLVTPMSPGILMIGKTIPYAVFGLLDASFILVVANLLFGVPLRGLEVVFVGCLTYLVTTLAVGLLISTVARTQQQALMGGFFFLLPAILLAGFITPIDAMPAWIQPLTLVDPVRWFIEILRTVLLRRAGFADVVVPLAALALLAVGTLAVATLRFRRTIG